VVFSDRIQAARLLAAKLAGYRGTHPLVLAVPRGALPMGEVIAEALDGDLDVVLVHKLAAPGNPEYAIGAVSETGELELRPEAREFVLDPHWLEAQRLKETQELARRRAFFTPGRSGAPIDGRTAIVVDDGVATGATLLAALKLVRRSSPRRLVAAVAVAPPAAVEKMRAEADEVVCLQQPALFWAVGQFFDDFRQVEDQEVVAILERAARRRAAAATASAPA
jgi:predicted phosphoribosyltransferase